MEFYQNHHFPCEARKVWNGGKLQWATAQLQATQPYIFKGSGSHLQSQNVRLDKDNVCRSKYHVGTLLKNEELETNVRLTYIVL